MGAKDLATVTGLALLDSLNISLILVTLYLLMSQRRPVSRIAVFLGVFYAVYVVVGIALTAGAVALRGRFGGDVGKYIELAIGIALVLYGFIASTESKDWTARASFGHLTVAGIALAVSAAEVATALPYLAAISVIGQSGLGATATVLVLLAYNFVVILPCVLATVGYRAMRERFQQRFDSFLAKRRGKGSRKGLLLLCIIAGFYIATDALVQFEFFGLVQFTDEQRRQIHGT
ncbi:GAP family protein [Amycolatopsis sp. NPDC059657]|uniref:GAP family protein n=1 Tax=Amycolatopsis sp. NPDC059657 TaxID=3346899 RepID=UPI00366DA1CE